ncbi:MAG: DUF3558 domain-containing protein [Actinomycetota bacterium]|nr:DUF3558 domain-containing protein [Actinomycetota bacterium]
MALASGCSATSGSPRPVPDETVSSSTPDSSVEPSASTPPDGDRMPGGAPTVKKPLDTSSFQAAPCSVLTKEQLASLPVLVPGETDLEDPLGPVCGWDDDSVGISFDGGFLKANTKGLDSLYSQHSKGSLGLFEPLPDIEGYPAVIYGKVDSRKSGLCAVAVGVTDRLTFTVVMSLSRPNPEETDPCPSARKAAELAMATMAGGA